MKKLIALLLLLPALAFGQMYWQPPSGSAGGDLTGTYPNPVVNRIGGFGTDQVLPQSGVPSSVTGTTTITTLGTVVIPANTLKVGSLIRVTSWWGCSNTANNKTIRTNVNGLQNNSFLVTNNVSGGTNPAVVVQSVWVVKSGGILYTLAAQTNPYATAGDSSAAIDVTQANSLNFTGQLAVTTDTLTLEAYTAEIVNP